MTKNNKKTSLIAALCILGISAATAEAVHLIKKLTAESAKEVAEKTEPEMEETEAADQICVITAQQAKEMMDSENGYIILDVRGKDEYAQGHIPGSKLIPLDELEARAKEELAEKDQLIFVYCRSGRRSHTAAQMLLDQGYTNIKDMGGILNWPYAIAK